MGDLSLLTTLPTHVNGKHLTMYRWQDGCGWSIEVDGHHFENREFDFLVRECLNYFKDYEYIHERGGYGLKGSREKIIQKVELNYFY